MIQIVELHYRDVLSCDFQAVKTRAEQILGSKIDSSDPRERNQAFILFHKEYPGTYKEWQIPAQTAILVTEKPTEIEAYRQDIEQSWKCGNAEELLSSSQSSCLITEMMSRGMSPHDRVWLFHGVLRAMIENTKPNALVCKHSQQVVVADDYLAACSEDPILRPGALNVRFYNISNSEGDLLMDTRGLTEIGLHDLQCHFRNLDPGEVARVLLNTAVYVFEKGPVIQSGETVEGIQAGSKWLCQLEMAIMEPKREVLDLNPGNGFAAGRR